MHMSRGFSALVKWGALCAAFLMALSFRRKWPISLTVVGGLGTITLSHYVPGTTVRFRVATSILLR